MYNFVKGTVYSFLLVSLSYISSVELKRLAYVNDFECNVLLLENQFEILIS